MHPHHRFAFEIDEQSVELVDYLLGVALHFLNLLFSGRERFSLPGRELVGLEIRITGKNPLHVGDDLIVSRLEAFIGGDELAMFVQLRRRAQGLAVRILLEDPLNAIPTAEQTGQEQVVLGGHPKHAGFARRRFAIWLWHCRPDDSKWVHEQRKQEESIPAG